MSIARLKKNVPQEYLYECIFKKNWPFSEKLWKSKSFQ